MSNTPERIDLHAMATETANTWDRAQLRKAGRYQAHLEGENLRLASELEELRSGNEALREVNTELAQRSRQTVPRVITAEELRDGQWVAFKPRLGADWGSGYAEEGPSGVGLVGWTVKIAPDDAFAIILLEDVPEQLWTTCASTSHVFDGRI